MYKKRSIGVVVPALNEEMLIVPTLASMPAFVDRIYVVDDGSTDSALGRMHERATQGPRGSLLCSGSNQSPKFTVYSGRCMDSFFYLLLNLSIIPYMGVGRICCLL